MPRFSLASLTLLALLAVSCGGGGAQEGRLPPGPRDPQRNLDLLASFADRAWLEGLDGSWRSARGEEAETARFGRRPLIELRPVEIETLRARLSRPGDLARLAAVEALALQLRHDEAPGVTEALAALDAARARLSLDDPALQRVQLESDDEAERRAAWMRANAGAEELEPLVVELQRARARWAWAESGETALAAFRSVDGLDEETRSRLTREVAAALRANEGAPLETPWNLEAENPALARELTPLLPAARIQDEALSLLHELGADAVAWHAGHDATGYSTHATWAVDPPDDVRVLVSPEDGLAGAWRVLHEAGHATQAALAPRDAPPLLQRTRSRAVAEGAAKLLERLAFAPEWLRPLGASDEQLAALAKWEARSERGRARRILGDAAFEELLHESPEGALDAMHRASWAEFGLLSPHEVPAWAAERSLSHAPGSRIGYLLGRCVQAAVYRRLRAQPGGLLGEESLRLLREEILPSAAGSSYEEWFEIATGEPPSCEAWLEDVAWVR